MLIEWAILSLFVLAAGVLMRSVMARRAARRVAGTMAGENVGIPCRVSWKQGLGRRGFVYGKLTRDAEAAVFKRPARRPVSLPLGGRVFSRPSLRPGMRLFEYRGPGGEEIRLQFYEAEAHLVADLLRIPDPADFA